MAISTQDQTKLLKVVVGLFNAVPGQSFLSDFESFIENGGTQQALARSLAATTVFTNTLSSASTSAEQAAILAGNFGLTADNVAGSVATQAINFFTDGINARTNIGDLVYEAVMFLSNNPPAEFAALATLLDNKVAVSAAYSATKGFGDDLSVLQAALNGITGTVVLTPAEINALVVAAAGNSAPGTLGNFTLTATADSVNEGDALIYTVTANQPVAANTDVVFTVVPGNSASTDGGTGTTNLNDFFSGSFNPVTVTIAAGQTTATFSVTGTVDNVIELPESYSVTAVVSGETLTKQTSLLDANVATQTLTTGSDNISGTPGIDVINGFVNTALPLGQTLTGADVINGGGGTQDVLNITVAGTAPGSAENNALISNVEILNIRAIAPTAFNGANIAGLTEVNSDRGTGTMTINNLANGVSFGLKGDNGVQLGAQTIGWAMGVTSFAVNIDGGVGPTGTVAPAVTLNALTAGTTATLNSTGLANEIGALTLGTPGNVTAATINAATDFTTGTVAAIGLVNLTTTGAGTVDLSAGVLPNTVTNVNAMANTGGTLVALGAAGTTSFAGGIGNDSVDLTTLGGAFSASAGLVGGNGTDLLVIANDTTILFTASANNISGFETLQVSGAGKTFNFAALTGLTSLEVDTAMNAVVNNIGAATPVTIIGDQATSVALNVMGAATAGNNIDNLTVTLDKAGSATLASIVTVAGMSSPGLETLNIVSSGVTGNNSTVMTDNNQITLNPLLMNNDLRNINVSGASDFTLMTGATPNVVGINGSTATGNLDIDASGNLKALAITGGTGVDTITGTIFGDVINGGAGNDIYEIGAVGSASSLVTSLTSFDTVTITSGDIFDSSNALTAGMFASGTQAPTAINSNANLLTALTTVSNAAITPLIADRGYLVTITDPGNTHAGTYLVIENGGLLTTTVDAADTVIELVGISGTATLSVDSNNDLVVMFA